MSASPPPPPAQDGGESGSDPAPVYLVRGDDAALTAQEARALIDRLVGARDPALVVEEHGGSAIDALDVGAVVDACTTPPFLVDRRVVVVRDAGRLSAADAKQLADALGDPTPRVSLVVVGGGGVVPQSLLKAVGAIGEVIEAGVGRTGRNRSQWLAAHLRDAPVRLNAGAVKRLGEHLGEDVGRLAGILDTLAAAYGAGATVGESELEPFLGEAGSVPPWDLTDAVDAGDTPGALRTLRRMTGPGGRQAPAVIALLHSHYSRMLRLDGADVSSAPEAAAFLGERSEFTAKKALSQGNRLGGDRIGQAIGLLAGADLDVKGRSALPSDVVLEILVARLSRLARTRSPAVAGRR